MAIARRHQHQPLLLLPVDPNERREPAQLVTQLGCVERAPRLHDGAERLTVGGERLPRCVEDLPPSRGERDAPGPVA